MIQNMLYDSAVVGIGRSGTTLVFNLLDNFYNQHTEKNPDSSFKLDYSHIKNKFNNNIIFKL